MKTRISLRKREGQIVSAIAQVERHSYCRLRGGKSGPESLLLRDVRDKNSGELIADHLWVIHPHSAVEPGAMIAFKAIAHKYIRKSGPQIAFDYALKGLYKVRAIN
jgi:hypothetical protein